MSSGVTEVVGAGACAGDWTCSDSDCQHINFARRTKCNRCQRERSIEPAISSSSSKKKLGTEIGKAAAEKSRGLFSAEDWQCSKCANVNWARRQTCNMCNAPKFCDVEERTGYGGGYNDRGVVEYKERSESDSEYDEFGRLKKRKRNLDTNAKSKNSRKSQRDIVDSGDDDDHNDEYNTKPKAASKAVVSIARKNIKKNAEEEEEDDDDDDDDDDDSGDLSKYDLWGDEDIATGATIGSTDKNDKNARKRNSSNDTKQRSPTKSRSTSTSSSSSSTSSSSSSSTASSSTSSTTRSRSRTRRSCVRASSRSRSPSSISHSSSTSSRRKARRYASPDDKPSKITGRSRSPASRYRKRSRSRSLSASRRRR